MSTPAELVAALEAAGHSDLAAALRERDVDSDAPISMNQWMRERAARTSDAAAAFIAGDPDPPDDERDPPAAA